MQQMSSNNEILRLCADADADADAHTHTHMGTQEHTVLTYTTMRNPPRQNSNIIFEWWLPNCGMFGAL